jgi:hypothetical protein
MDVDSFPINWPGYAPSGPACHGFPTREWRSAASPQAFSDQLPICDKFADWASWMSFSEPEVPKVH